ncbi:MAG: hypothetical protein HRU38_18085 [Saccharospirillaceae bacterium]|nr:hypothetical protein [Saccharospirillaceae bacterium]
MSAIALKPAESLRVNKISALTNREREFFQLFAKGLPDKLIARELDISDGSVKVQVKHLLKKLELTHWLRQSFDFLSQ